MVKEKAFTLDRLV